MVGSRTPRRVGELARSIALDIGSKRTRIADSGGELLAEVETVAAVDAFSYKVEAVGDEAIEIAAQKPGRYILAAPIENSKIKNVGLLNSFLARLAKSCDLKSFSRTKVAVAMPNDAKIMDIRAIQSCLSDLGVKEMLLVDSCLAATMGAGYDPSSPNGIMIADLGASRAEAAIIALGEAVSWSASKLGGASCNSQIFRFIEESYGIVVPRDVIEEIKVGLLKKGKRASQVKVSIWGRSVKTGVPASVIVPGEDLLGLMVPILDEMVGALVDALSACPPEIISDLYGSGISLVGGVALLEGMPELIESKTGLRAKRADTPQATVTQGLCAVLNSKRQNPIPQLQPVDL